MPLDAMPSASATAGPEHPASDRLSQCHLVLAIADLIRDRKPGNRLSTADVVDRLPRENAEEVRSVHHALVLRGLPLSQDLAHDESRSRGLLAERMRDLRRPHRQRRSRGLTIGEAARHLSIPRAAFVALCEAHGVLDLLPHNGRQRRRLVSETAEKAGLGWNVDAGRKRIGWLQGFNTACVFPVFDPDRIADLAWMLDWPGVVAAVGAIASRHERREFLLQHHAYLTDEVIAGLTGFSRSMIQKARQQAAARRGDRTGHSFPA